MHWIPTLFGMTILNVSGSLSAHHQELWAEIRLRTPDAGQIGCPKHVESSYQIKLEFSAPVGFFILFCYDARSYEHKMDKFIVCGLYNTSKLIFNIKVKGVYCVGIDIFLLTFWVDDSELSAISVMNRLLLNVSRLIFLWTRRTKMSSI